MTEKLQSFIAETEARIEAETRETQRRKAELRERQRTERKALQDKQEARAQQEAAARAARFRKGLGGLWDWVSGKTRRTKRQNEEEAAEAARRDAEQKEAMIAAQLTERRVLQRDLREKKREAVRQADDLRQDVAFYLELRAAPADDPKPMERANGRHREGPVPSL
jgi:hypothetical protein